MVIQDRGVMALIVGSSEGLPVGNLETRATKAAQDAGIPIFVIEDFPGNFSGSSEYRVNGLFVEDAWTGELHHTRGVPSEVVHTLGNPRYDGLNRLPRADIRRKMRAQLGLGDQPVVLWAGQPDGSNSFQTLERLAPALRKSGAILLMKAHPRDEFYARGIYRELIPHLDSVLDVTAERDIVGLCCAADLIITQFSSVGVEAMYLGTPTLFALFRDLGQAYLRMHKGYAIVPWAANGSAFLLESSDDALACVDWALFDEPARARRRQVFDDLYGARPASGPAIAGKILQDLGAADLAESTCSERMAHGTTAR